MDTDNGYGYAVVAQLVDAGCGGEGSCNPGGGYFVTSAIGSSTVIDNTQAFSSNAKLSDAQINAISLAAKEFDGSAGGVFKWYIHGSSTDYVYLRAQTGATYSTTAVFTQQCTRNPTGTWSPFYTATTDYGLTTRSYASSSSANKYVRCRFTDDNCDISNGCDGHGTGWDGMIAMRHSSTYIRAYPTPRPCYVQRSDAQKCWQPSSICSVGSVHAIMRSCNRQ
jgi:hypothetical protein